MPISKKQKIWIVISVAITVPLVVRDLIQQATLPEFQQGRLFSAPATVRSGFKKVNLTPGVTAFLAEIKTTVPDGAVAWIPGSSLLDEDPPVQPFPQNSDGTYIPPHPSNFQPYRFVVNFSNAENQPIRVLIGTQPETSVVYSPQFDFPAFRTARWIPLPGDSTTADVYAGVALESERRTLVQKPYPGKLGVSYGPPAQWRDPRCLDVTIPAAERPQYPNSYLIEVKTIDSLGAMRHAGDTVMVIMPNTERLSIPIQGGTKDPVAVRAMITPYHWGKFPAVSLAVPQPERAQLRPIPITERLEEIRDRIVQSGPMDGYFEIAHRDVSQLTHPQMLKPVPNAIVLSLKSHTDNENPVLSDAAVFYAFVPKKWVHDKIRLPLVVKTTTGAIHTEAESITTSGTVDGYYENGFVYLSWQFPSIPYSKVESISLRAEQRP